MLVKNLDFLKWLPNFCQHKKSTPPIQKTSKRKINDDFHAIKTTQHSWRWGTNMLFGQWTCDNRNQSCSEPVSQYGHACSKLYNNEKASKDFEARKHKVWDNMLSQTHHYGLIQNGKAMELNSAEIKIVRTEAKLQVGSFPLRLSVTWSNYFFNVWPGIRNNQQVVTDWFQHPPQLRWSLL